MAEEFYEPPTAERGWKSKQNHDVRQAALVSVVFSAALADESCLA